MEKAQLFTPGGRLVATVDVRLNESRWPGAVTYMGRLYVLVGGRYVESVVREVTGVVPAAAG